MKKSGWVIGISVDLPSSVYVPQLRERLNAVEDQLFEQGVSVAFEENTSASTESTKQYDLRVNDGQTEDFKKIEAALTDFEHWIESIGGPKTYKRSKEAE